MKKISTDNIKLKGYEFDDLSKEIQDKVISEHINFWMEVREYNKKNPGNFEKAIDKANEIKTPWFTGSYIYDYCKEEIIEEIKINNYLFNKKGEILPIKHYTKDNKIIKSVLEIAGNEIKVNIK
ncbi:MAG: hypothetical protein ACOCRK_07025 [bacterium]